MQAHPALRLRELETVLKAGPAAWGWQDQCWTLARIAELVYERFKMDYTLAGLDLLLHQLGWSMQVGVRQMQDRPGLLDGYLVGTGLSSRLRDRI